MLSKETTFIIFIGLAFLIVLIGHYSPYMTGFAIKEIDQGIIIDVRTLEEHIEHRIPDSILIPYDTIMFNIENRVPDKDTKIILYCRSGRRSSIARRTLESMGYTNVIDIGGILDWTGPTIRG